jgi:DNA-binding response OmpR family regulator
MTDVAHAAALPLVLLVDDDRDTRDMYATYLAVHGFHVEQAHDAQQALRMLGTIQPAVLVTDLTLPGLDGFTLARRARDQHREALRVVAVTGYSLENVAERARDAGVDRVLLKPCMPDRLVAEIRALLPAENNAR